MAAIFRLDKEKNVYKLEAYRDREVLEEGIAIPQDHPLIEYLLKTQEPLLLEDIDFVIGEELSQKEIKSFFDRLKIQLIIPSMTERNILGFLALGSKPDNQVFTDDDINVFKILAHQASLAIEIRAYDQAVQSIVDSLNDRDSNVAISCERSFLAMLGGGCQVPIAGRARVSKGSVTLEGMVASLDGTRLYRSTASGPV